MFGWLKNLFGKKTPRTFSHPELGVITFDCGVWGGSVWQGEREIRFSLGGTDKAPDEGSINELLKLLLRFRDVEQCAKDFLVSRESELSGASLEFYSLDLLWVDKSENFTFEFIANNDDSCVWRVEFIEGKPAQTGFDD